VAEARFLLDTNICIYLLGGAADSLRARIEQCEEGELATSTIAVAEVMVGARRLNAADEAEGLFRMLRVYRSMRVRPSPMPSYRSGAVVSIG
jgi:tRNA(fMet)-specific endonuclease VapC